MAKKKKKITKSLNSGKLVATLKNKWVLLCLGLVLALGLVVGYKMFAAGMNYQIAKPALTITGVTSSSAKVSYNLKNCKYFDSSTSHIYVDSAKLDYHNWKHDIKIKNTLSYKNLKPNTKYTVTYGYYCWYGTGQNYRQGYQSKGTVTKTFTTKKASKK